MDLPKNAFKAALKAGQQQIGLWNTLGGNTVPEALAEIGYDWIVVDTEHAARGVMDVLPALQAMAAYPRTTPVVRVVENSAATIKRVLDFGAQTILVPYVQSAEEAEAAVQAVRYPPAGMRGVAGGTRAGRYGQIKDYHARANDEICLIVQVETLEAADRLEEIALTEGVDGVFIGPADLSASMGYPGQPAHPTVKEKIAELISRLNAVQVPAGILATDPAYAKTCIELGTGFTAVGLDLPLMLNAARGLAAEFGRGPADGTA